MRFVFTSDLSGLGGGEVGVLYLAEHLMDEHQCLFIVRKHGSLVDELRNRNIPVEVIDYKDKRRLASRLKEVRAVVENFSPDAIFSNDPTTSILMRAATCGKKIKNYWMAHGQWYLFSRGKRLLLRRSVDAVFCVSNAVKQSLVKQGFDKCITSYLGVPKNIFSEVAGNQVLSKSDSKEKTVVTIARFQKIKGQLKGVEAVAGLIEDNIPIQYYLVGGSIYGSTEDESYEKLVHDKVKELSLSDQIHFLGERRDVSDIMHDADCLLIPSDNESLGLVALEALMAGLPIVSTPNDGVREILENNPLCVASSNDSLGLQKTLKRQLTMSDDDRRELKSLYKRLQEKYSISSVSNVILKQVQLDIDLQSDV